jgi:hypothetical protein
MEQIQQVINQEKILSKSEKINLSLVDIAKGIKQKLKKEFPLCKFSISTQYYSMGCALHISIIETNFKIIKPFEELSEFAINRYTVEDGYRTLEDLKNLQSKGHHQLNHYLDNEYNPDIWNNGVFLTEEGYKLVKRIVELTEKFNWNNSDSQTDYYDVKFSLHLSIGKYDKPLIEKI